MGKLAIQSGGGVSDNNAIVGNAAGSQGTMTVTGAGSTWTNNGDLTVGNSGTGTLTVADGGTVTSGGPVGVAVGSGSIGTLNIGATPGDAPAAAGTLNAAVVSFGAGTGNLNFNHTAIDYEFAPVISGNDSVNVFAGTTTLTANNTYTGATTVNGGDLVVNGSIASSSLTAVNSRGTLAGSGTWARPSLTRGGTLAPGGVGTPGTINLGPLTLNSGSNLSYQVGTPNVIGGPTNDLTNVNGALTHQWRHAVRDRLINYTMGTTPGGNGQLAIGTLPDRLTGLIQTSIPGEVNLIATAPLPTTQFWNGSTLVGDGVVHGGNGTWNNTLTNWTTSTGTANASWQGNMAVFEGAAGTVTVTDPIAYKGLLSTGGYVVTASGGGVLMPTGSPRSSSMADWRRLLRHRSRDRAVWTRPGSGH